MNMKNGLQQSKKLTKLNSEFLKIYHQSIRSLRRKTHELLSHVYSDLPHVMCLSELHLKASELSLVNIESYTIKAQFSSALHEGGGVITYVHNSLKFIYIDLSEYCQEKNIEICVIKIKSNSLSSCILALYRAPSGNFAYLLQNLDNILHSLYSPSI